MTLDRVLSKQQPRVISVLSYYLTSLVNLSFCRLDLRFFEILWLILAPSCQFRLHLSVPFETSRFNTCLCHLPLLSYAIISSSYVTYYFTFCDKRLYYQQQLHHCRRHSPWNIRSGEVQHHPIPRNYYIPNYGDRFPSKSLNVDIRQELITI